MSKRSHLINLCKSILSSKSITPNAGNCYNIIKDFLEPHSPSTVESTIHDKSLENSHSTDNFFASIGDGREKSLCFAGHVDVVHPGLEYKWLYNPFEPTIDDGKLYARGVVDMKCAIAVFLCAMDEFIKGDLFDPEKHNFGVLLTSDEEGNGINGMKPFLKEVTAKGFSLKDVLVGEPTSQSQIGDIVKIGRRGSIRFDITVQGHQGHIAYPANFLNPIPCLAGIITELHSHIFDDKSEDFDQSNLEVVMLECDNATINVVPDTAKCTLNIRYNPAQNRQTLTQIVHNACKKVCGEKYKYSLSSYHSAEAFLSKDDNLVATVSNSIKEVTSFEPALSTTGGTSDARFIKDYANVIELGLKNATAHQIDEHAEVEDIYWLYDIYYAIIKNYFK